MKGTGLSALTLPQRLLQRGGAHPEDIALRQKTDRGWVDVTWRDYADRANACAAGLIELGLEPPRRQARAVYSRAKILLLDDPASTG